MNSCTHDTFIVNRWFIRKEKENTMGWFGYSTFDITVQDIASKSCENSRLEQPHKNVEENHSGDKYAHVGRKERDDSIFNEAGSK